MINSNKAVTICNGLATLTINGTASPLCVGEIATHRPFEALLGFEKGMGIPVSDEKFDGVVRRQENFSKTERNLQYLKKFVRQPREEQQFLKNSSTLLKNISEDTFFIDVTPRTIEFVTGKKTVYNKGADGKTKSVKPKLTPAEIITCVLYEYAYDVFRTEKGIEIKVSFSNGTELEWK